MAKETVEQQVAEERTRRIRELAARERAIVAERYAIHKANRGKVENVPQVSDSQRRIASLATKLLAGLAPADLEPAALSTDQRLAEELAAIEKALSVLLSQECQARAAAALLWIEKSKPKWLAVARKVMLAAVGFENAVQEAHALVAECPDRECIGAVSFPLFQFISANCFVDLAGNQLREVVIEAIERGVLSQAEARLT